jgi:hypothetical protein
MVILYATTLVILAVAALLAAIATVERSLVSIIRNLAAMIIEWQRLVGFFKKSLATHLCVKNTYMCQKKPSGVANCENDFSILQGLKDGDKLLYTTKPAPFSGNGRMAIDTLIWEK